MSARDGEVFVPNGASREQAAVLLVGTAKEYGIDVRLIRTTPTGFYAPEELISIAYPEAKKTTAKKAAAKKTSGNRAAKTGTDKE